MREYEGFIRKMKEYEGRANYDRMFSQIEQKISTAPKVRLALAAVLAVLLIGFIAYSGFQSQREGGDLLMSYVFEREDIDGPLLDYVFLEDGTF